MWSPFEKRLRLSVSGPVDSAFPLSSLPFDATCGVYEVIVESFSLRPENITHVCQPEAELAGLFAKDAAGLVSWVDLAIGPSLGCRQGGADRSEPANPRRSRRLHCEYAHRERRLRKRAETTMRPKSQIE